MTTTEHLYIHIPFCLSKCGYCAFYSVPESDQTKLDRYVRGVSEELQQEGAGCAWQTVYLGGGTPSLLGPGRTAGLLDLVRSISKLASNAEVTLEVNPETVEDNDLAAYQLAGVNRVSIGVQSFDDGHLALLGRAHTAGRARTVVEQALDLGLEVSLDLIYGLPGQSHEQWCRQLELASALGVGHISAYELTLEPGTPLAGRLSEAGHQSDERFFFATHEVLESLGFEGYEVSSFARTVLQQSRHNLATWAGRSYLGLGPGAHSLLPTCECGVRRWNLPDLTAYLKAVESGGPPPRESEELSKQQRLLELLMLGLRTRRGVDLEAVTMLLPGKLDQLVAFVAAPGFKDLVHLTNNRLCPTLSGMAQADGLAVQLFSSAGPEV